MKPMLPNAIKKLASVKEAEIETGVSQWTWRNLAYSGKVESIKIGTRLLIPVSEIERVIAEGRRPRAAGHAVAGGEAG